MEFQSGKERRQFERFKARESAVILMEDGIGQILDISAGGISMKCLHRHDCDGDGNGRFSIALSSSGFHLEHLPVRKVWERKPRAAESPMMMKDVGLQFEKLNRAQQAQIRYFIQSYTEMMAAGNA